MVGIIVAMKVILEFSSYFEQECLSVYFFRIRQSSLNNVSNYKGDKVMKNFEFSIRKMLSNSGMEDEKIRAIRQLTDIYQPDSEEISYNMHIFFGEILMTEKSLKVVEELICALGNINHPDSLIILSLVRNNRFRLFDPDYDTPASKQVWSVVDSLLGCYGKQPANVDLGTKFVEHLKKCGLNVRYERWMG